LEQGIERMPEFPVATLCVAHRKSQPEEIQGKKGSHGCQVKTIFKSEITRIHAVLRTVQYWGFYFKKNEPPQNGMAHFD
jgi:hypothetical protein